MIRVIMLAATLLVGGCNDPDPADPTAHEQRALDYATVVCRDHVEYLASYGYGRTLSFTPHLQTNGKPFPCKTKQ